MLVVSQEVAEKEVSDWLDKKKIFPQDREALKYQIDVLVSAVSNGVISIDEQGNLIHKLLFPLDNEKPVTTLKYKGRLAEKDTRRAMKGVSPGDVDGRVNALIMSLTDESSGVIGALDTADSKIAKAITNFFF